MTRFAMIAFVLAACAPDDASTPSGESGGGTSTTGDESGSEAAEPSTNTSSSETGTSSTGEPETCPLAGVFRECGDGGRQYCDELDGELRFGPCLESVACELTDADTCTTMCELIDGVPTVVEHPDLCSTSG